MTKMIRLILLVLASTPTEAFHASGGPLQHRSNRYHGSSKTFWRLKDAQSSTSANTIILSPEEQVVAFTDLMVMDVVLFQRKDTSKPLIIELGSVQENGNVAPLSTWTLESAYENSLNDMMEFVVDEEDLFPGMTSDEVTVLRVLDGDVVGYGSRQVGGGKGLGNPHGEESEIIYYVDRTVVEGTYATDADEALTIDAVVNPNLEHLW